jgi:hypothetical protein
VAEQHLLTVVVQRGEASRTRQSAEDVCLSCQLRRARAVPCRRHLAVGRVARHALDRHAAMPRAATEQDVAVVAAAQLARLGLLLLAAQDRNEGVDAVLLPQLLLLERVQLSGAPRTSRRRLSDIVALLSECSVTLPCRGQLALE